MMQTVVVSGDNEAEFEKQLNKTLKDCAEKGFRVKDVKFSSFCMAQSTVVYYSALVLYDEE
jgi:hypothetical protein